MMKAVDSFNQVSRMLSVLTGKRSALQAQHARLERTISEAKARLLWQDKIDSYLRSLQARANERATGVFEELLSALVKDIFGEGSHSVKLDLATKGGLPWLDIHAQTEKGHIEDLFEGNGGGLTNIICAGLRYSCLVRSGNRRFLILDEPDCWLEDDMIPAFFKVVYKVAKLANVQTLLITHKDISYLPSDIGIVELYKKGDTVYPRILQNSDLCEDDGVHSITLENFRTHTNTTIPLFKHMTVLRGGCNVGKSAVVSAFRALTEGESDDTMLHHGASEFNLTLLFDSYQLEMRRVLKGNPKVSFKLEDMFSGEVLFDGPQDTRNTLPEKISAKLKLGKIEGLDVQISRQKTPVFLLDQPGTTRAQLLSAGRESSYISNMIEEYRKDVRTDKAQVKSGEGDLAKLHQVLVDTASLQSLQENWLSLKELAEGKDSLAGTIAELQGLTISLESQVHRLEKCQELTALAELPDPVAIPPLADLAYMVEELSRLTQAVALKLHPMPEPEPISDLGALAEVITRIAALERVAGLTLQPLPDQEKIPDFSQLDHLIAEQSKMTGYLQASLQRESAVRADLDDLALDRDLLVEDLGGLCPLCGNTLHDSADHSGVH